MQGVKRLCLAQRFLEMHAAICNTHVQHSASSADPLRHAHRARTLVIRLELGSSITAAGVRRVQQYRCEFA